MELYERIRGLKKAGLKDYQIIKYMRNDGFSDTEIDEAIISINKELEESFTKKHPILTNKYLPLILLIFNYLLFFHIIPIGIAESFQILFAILGGALMVVFSFWTFGALLPKLFDKQPVLLSLVAISSLFVFGYFFISMTSDYESNQLKNFGVETKAVIIDKTKIYGRRGHTSCSMTVKFRTKENEIEKADILLSNAEYNSFKNGMMIYIYYSSENPDIARISRKTYKILNSSAPR